MNAAQMPREEFQRKRRVYAVGKQFPHITFDRPTFLCQYMEAFTDVQPLQRGVSLNDDARLFGRGGAHTRFVLVRRHIIL
jgi:hypothetical protein